MQTISPILTLALNIQSNRGRYALLLGSGISTSARIKTGWQITQDLIRRVARGEGKENECQEGVEEIWFRETYQQEPDYSRLLEKLGITEAERHGLLQGYFEPTDEEATNGIKVPTKAHRDIANLIKQGFIDVVITTNFDRLLEKALLDLGIEPHVLSTKEHFEGAYPIIHHNSHLIIKVNGDYKDKNIRNTLEELEQYPDSLNELLSFIAKNYGLVICGWSATYDNALRGALLSSKVFHFGNYWAKFGNNLPEQARDFIQKRRAVEIPIQSADQFFEELETKVIALERSQIANPLSIQVAVATVKRFIETPNSDIKLYDLVLAEQERLVEAMKTPSLLAIEGTQDPENIIKRMLRYEAITEAIQGMIVEGAGWGKSEQQETWLSCIRRIFSIGLAHGDEYSKWKKLALYPAMLLTYSAGIAAISRKKYAFFVRMAKTKVSYEEREERLFLKVRPNIVFNFDVIKTIPDYKNHRASGIQYLYDLLKNRFKALLPDELEFEKYFDRFEYLMALVSLAQTKGQSQPPPTFCRFLLYFRKNAVDIEQAFEEEFSGSQEDDLLWKEFLSLFNGDLTNYKAHITNLNKYFLEVKKNDPHSSYYL